MGAQGGEAFAVGADLSADWVVKIWVIATGQELRSWELKFPLVNRVSFNTPLAFSPDGKQLGIGNANTTLFVLDLP